MRYSALLAALFLTLPPVLLSFSTAGAVESVNPIIGDVSFELRFGRSPRPGDPEVVRIRTHLEYVESALRARDVSGLPGDLQAARNQHLDRLRDYWQRGVFPQNRLDSTRRLPCFIDDDGRLCAVACLIEQSAGMELALQINDVYQYARLADMKMAELGEWVAGSGLTEHELAMIQPGYGPPIDECAGLVGMSWGMDGEMPVEGDKFHLAAWLQDASPLMTGLDEPTPFTLTIADVEWRGSGALFDTIYHTLGGGTFGIYASSSFPPFVQHPPNSAVPGQFATGAALLTGVIEDFYLTFHSDGTPLEISGRMYATGGARADDFYDVIEFLSHSVRRAGSPGYHLFCEGNLLGGCGLTPVESTTWARLKARYR